MNTGLPGPNTPQTVNQRTVYLEYTPVYTTTSMNRNLVECEPTSKRTEKSQLR